MTLQTQGSRIVDSNGDPIRLKGTNIGGWLNMENFITGYRNPFAGTRLSEDDVAVADLLERTGAWARGEGAEPYSLADGLQDHLISVAIGESAETGRDVTTEREAWAR